jgi:hypothetical protein
MIINKKKGPHETVLRIRIRNPVPFDPLIRDPGGMDKKIKIRLRDEHPGSYFRELSNRNLFDPGSGIRDKHPVSATLIRKNFIHISLF